MTGQNSFWFANPSTGFYPFTIDQSIRITKNGYLNMSTNGFANAPTLTTKGTVSFWIKLQNNGGRNYIMQNEQAYSNDGLMDIRFGGSASNDGMHIGRLSDTPYTASTTGPVQRDYTNWYHCVVGFDSTSATASDRQIRIYINGTQVTTGSFGAINQNAHFPLTKQGSTYGGLTFGQHPNPSFNYFTDMLLAEINIIDGQRLDASYFGEFKNGTWIPIEYTGTYGNNGCRFTFASSDFNTSGGSVSDPNGSSVDLFNNGISDASGNGNHLNLNSVSTHDISLDSPTNNFSVLNKLDARYGTLDEGNLENTYATTGELIRSTFAQKSGKWYAEVNCIAGSGFNLGIYPTEGLNKDSDTNYGCQYRGSTGQKVVSNSVSSYGATYGANDIIGIAVDMDNNTVTFYKNNSSQGSISYTIDEHHAFSSYISSGNTAFWNFGQDSSFGGNETAQGNQDENGVGDFYYSPPSGYLALCSSNLSDTTLSPNQAEQADDYFNTILWTGDDSTPRTITGVNFQPDWIWTKARSSNSGYSQNHWLADSSRGAGSNSLLTLYSNLTDAEFDATGTNGNLTAITSDGFTITEGSGSNRNRNNNGETFVAWNWKANGGTTSSNTDGSITSTVQASTDAGFSIVTYTGTGSNATIGHGLGVAPSVVMTKVRNTANNWGVFHSGINDNTKALLLDTTDAAAAYGGSTGMWNNTAPTSTVFSVGTNGSTGGSANYVAYCFAEIEGYSKFGSYIGNGSTDGTFIYLGFRPAWFLLKRSDTSANWLIYDNKRDPDNRVAQGLFPNLSSAETEQTGGFVDFVSDGVKLKEDGTAMNASGGTFVYLAFAEQPFKFSNAR